MFRKSISTALLFCCASGAAAQAVDVPSGLEVSLFDVIFEDDPQVARFRFLVPAIGQSDAVAFSDVAIDFQYLCDALVIPGLAANNWAGSDVVISMSAENVSFGTVTSEITQFFQPFRIEDKTCIWEDF